jgi:alpha-galactosidase
MKFIRSITLLLLVGHLTAARAVSPSPAELVKARGFFETSFLTAKTQPPFSFQYDGRPSSEFLATWKMTDKKRSLSENRVQRTVTFTDPKSGLAVRCVAIEYTDSPVVEWTLYFKNTGATDTPVLDSIQALDMNLRRGDTGDFVLHHAKGSQATINDYEPYETAMPAGFHRTITTSGGRPSNSDFPYFNIEWPGQGVICAIGWPGQWAAQFSRDDANGLSVRAGQETTHFKLHPGEEVRGPLISLLFWSGDWIRSQNLWRQWMVTHILPRVDGKPLPPTMFACSSHQFGEMVHATEENQILFIDRYAEKGLKLDYWWMDAGWYVNNGSWVNTGTWEVDSNRFPHGLRAVSDHAHDKGLKTLVWFEPERVTTNSWLGQQHPEWLLSPPPNPGDQAYGPDWRLLDLGNPAARQWLIDHVDNIIKTQRIDLYRQDFNIDPLYYWRAHDEPDRQGLTEIKYVTGYLAYWDALKQRNPKLLFDSCASGGRRLDLETMRRSVPRTRSDYLFEPIGEQCHTYGLALWIPYYGSGFIDTVTYQQKESQNYYGQLAAGAQDVYIFRSVMCPVIINCLDVRRDDLHYDVLRQLFSQWRDVSPYLLGDYYPLTPYSTAKDTWIAWQFDRHDLGGGVVLAYRRNDNTESERRLKLSALDAEAKYAITNSDVPGSNIVTGRQLMEEGLLLTITNQPGAIVITYQKAN